MSKDSKASLARLVKSQQKWQARDPKGFSAAFIKAEERRAKMLKFEREVTKELGKTTKG